MIPKQVYNIPTCTKKICGVLRWKRSFAQLPIWNKNTAPQWFLANAHQPPTAMIACLFVQEELQTGGLQQAPQPCVIGNVTRIIHQVKQSSSLWTHNLHTQGILNKARLSLPWTSTSPTIRSHVNNHKCHNNIPAFRKVLMVCISDPPRLLI